MIKYIALLLLIPLAASACGNHKYSVDEIGKMREQVKWLGFPHGNYTEVWFIGSDAQAQVEDKLRTYMCNGTTLKELKAKNSALDKAARAWEKSMDKTNEKR